MLHDEPLSRHTTFRIGGPARRFLRTPHPDEAAAAAGDAIRNGLPFVVIGGGSNLVPADEGMHGLVIALTGSGAEVPAPVVLGHDDETVALLLPASMPFWDVPAVAWAHGAAGVAWATGIPGSLGGAVLGNAGAFGRQIGDVTTAVHTLTPDGRARTVHAAACDFAYRSSGLARSRDIVLRVAVRLPRADAASLDADVAEAARIAALRREKHPDLQREPSAGSVFKNLAPTSAAGRREAAGALLERAGAKGLTEGGAAVYAKHANIIVNTGGAEARDVFRLAARMRTLARDAAGIALELEQAYWTGAVAGPNRPIAVRLDDYA